MSLLICVMFFVSLTHAPVIHSKDLSNSCSSRVRHDLYFLADLKPSELCVTHVFSLRR